MRGLGKEGRRGRRGGDDQRLACLAAERRVVEVVVVVVNTEGADDGLWLRAVGEGRGGRGEEVRRSDDLCHIFL